MKIPNRIKNVKISEGAKKKLLIAYYFAILLFCIYMMLFLVPEIYNFTIGKNTIERHIETVIGNETDEMIKAQNLMTWFENNTLEPYGQKPIVKGLLWGVYNLEEKPRLFIKTNRASWVIHSKLGNCGEAAWYFVEIMNKTGTYARVISVSGEDHVLAEFYTKDGRKQVVDPSSNTFINNTLERGNGSQWSYLEATDLEGNKEDVTKEYIPNLSTLTIQVNDSFLRKHTQITLNSVYLKSRSKLYESPIQVVSANFRNNNTFSVNVGAKSEYQLVKGLNFYLFFFKEEQDIDLSHNVTLNLSPNELIKITNLRITTLGWTFFLLVMLSVLLILTLSQNRRKENTKRI